jgi:hypothetical protein
MDKESLILSCLIAQKLYAELFCERVPQGMCENWSEKRADALDRILKKYLAKREYQIISLRFDLRGLTVNPWGVIGAELQTSPSAVKTSGWRAIKRLRSHKGALAEIKLVCTYSEMEAEIYATNLFIELLDLYGSPIVGGRNLRACQIKQDLKLFLSVGYDYICEKQMEVLANDDAIIGSRSIKVDLLERSIESLKTDTKSYNAFYDLIDHKMRERISRL